MKTKLFTIAILAVTIGSNINTEKPISVTVTSAEKKYESQEISSKSNINNFNPGENLFKAKCATCHSVMKDGKGPKLKGALKKWEDAGEGDLIYEWVRNNFKLRSSGKSKRAIQIFDEWNGALQPIFADLTNEEIDWIFDYVENGYVEDTITSFEYEPITNINNFNPGENLFKAKCATCHSVMKDGKGPKLKGALKKWEDAGEGDLIYEWVRNNFKLRSSGKSKRAIQIFDEWNGALQPKFAVLTNEEIDWIFDYVENGM